MKLSDLTNLFETVCMRVRNDTKECDAVKRKVSTTLSEQVCVWGGGGFVGAQAGFRGSPRQTAIVWNKERHSKVSERKTGGSRVSHTSEALLLASSPRLAAK